MPRPANSSSSADVRAALARADAAARRFRAEPVAGRLKWLKRPAFRLLASPLDRQAATSEAVLEAAHAIADRLPAPSGGVSPALAGGFAESMSVHAQLLPAERAVLFALVHGLAPRRVLEIGTCEGGSATIIAAALDARDQGLLVCVDPAFQVEPAIRARLSRRAAFVEAPSPDGLGRARELAGGPFDLALIDGDHTAEGVHRDIAGVLPVMADTGTLLFHDAHHPDVDRAIGEAVAGNPGRLLDAGLVSVDESRVDGSVWGGLRLVRCVGP